MKAIVVDKDYGSVSLKELEQIAEAYRSKGIELELMHLQGEEEIIRACGDADAILATGNPPITERVCRELPNLKLVQRFGIGVNSVDLDGAARWGKLILNMPGFCVEELAVHATSLALGLMRNSVYYDREIRKGNWPKAKGPLPKEMSNVTLGLYGFGGSARPLYEIFRHGFHSRVITCDPYVPEEERKKFDVEFVSFEEMLEQSDVLSIHAPLNQETRHIFNARAFAQMKESAILINVARGPLVDEQALVEALQSGQIRGAGLDVFESEPLDPASPLRQMDNVVLTCHSAFYGEGSKKTQVELAVTLVPQALLEHKIPKKYVANRAVMEQDLPYEYI